MHQDTCSRMFMAPLFIKEKTILETAQISDNRIDIFKKSHNEHYIKMESISYTQDVE